MHCLHRHSYVIGLQQGLQRYQNLLGQPLLHLWSLSKEPNDAVDFAKSDNFIAREVRNPSLAVNRHKVMFTSRRQIDVINITISSTFILLSMTEIFGKLP